jgi:DNA mismatch repair protein MutS2
VTGPLADTRTLESLEMDRVIACVAGRAASAAGRALALAARPDLEPDDLVKRRRLVTEMRALAGVTDDRNAPRLPSGFDLGFLDDLDELFVRLDRGGVLEGEQILRLARLIRPSLDLRSTARNHADRLPALAALVEEHGLEAEGAARSLEQADLEVAAVLDEGGSVKDSASPELRKLRKQARDLRARLSGRARKLVEKHAAHLTDDFYTLRDDRYVLPVRSDARASVRGIIHGSSNSGATLFVEPDVLVDDCNELKVVEGEALAREREVLADLSATLMRLSGALERLSTMLARIDLVMAIARFAEETDAIYPELVEDPVIDLRSVRHPLLVLAGQDVVSNDVTLGAGQGWVLSGPNAGGKTVLLKTVGLAVLMTYAGLPAAASGGSVVGAFDHVRAEIGDAQSVEGNLSTFSAQVTNLASILEGAGASSLLLLDELAAGTDPDEGAALAEALVHEMLERGAAVVIATHFEPLKRLSISSDVLVAAGMGFDLESLEPTFRLHPGMPGTSGGLLVAERYGLPARVVARARELLGKGRGPEEGRLRALERLRQDLEGRLREAEEQQERLRTREVRLESRERDLMQSQRRRMLTEERYLATELTVLRSELKHAHKVLRRRPLDTGDVTSSERVASRLGRALAPGGPVSRLARPRPEGTSAGPSPPEPGARVYVPRLELEGVVEDVTESRVRIRKGSIAWTVELEDVTIPSEPARPAGEPVMEDGRDLPQDEEEAQQTSYNTIDLRGHGLDEAQIDLDSFLDEALEMGIEEVFVIHGHGKGVLKTGLRRYLRHLKKVESFRSGKRGEGGDGVTVCKLRSD